MKGFIYSCIGDNSPENREHLEKLGWKRKYIQEDADVIVCASNTGAFSAIAQETQSWFKEYQSECIDCRHNPALFQAVTAMRDDSDYLQWFVSDEDIFTKDGDDIVVSKGDFILSKEVDLLCKHQDYQREAHKATLSELLEHFKLV